MDIRNVARKVGIGIVLIIVLLFASFGPVISDVASYTAIGSQTLHAQQQPRGKGFGSLLSHHHWSC